MSQRGFIDLGPAWLWCATFVLAIIGLLAILGGLGWIAHFLITHLRWT